jgi:hypothetical protein
MVQVYKVDWFTYLVVLRDKKLATDHRYNFVNVNWINEEEFNKAI